MENKDAVRNASSIDFWREVCPRLSISQNPFSLQLPDFGIDHEEAIGIVSRMRTEGYFRTGQVVPLEETVRIAEAIRTIVSLGFPAVFVLVYDDVWRMLSRMGGLVRPLLGTDVFCLTRDVWVYYVRAATEEESEAKEDRGWTPHRDGHSTIDTLRPDGSPQLMGLWVPFTETTVEQSCIYVLPTHLDPNYPANLASKELPLSALQGIRALPAQAGAVMGWNEYLLHWGSRPSAIARQPRISLAARFQTKEVPPMDGGYLERDGPFDFEDRLGVVGTLVTRYKGRVRCPEALAQFCERQALLYRAVEQVRRVGARQVGLC